MSRNPARPSSWPWASSPSPRPAARAPPSRPCSAANAALDQAKPEIEKYVPGELKALTSEMSKAKAAFDKGDYKRALAAGQAVVPKVQAALEAARKKKDELVAAFDQLKDTLPALVDALKARLWRKLARAQTLPAGLDQATVETAQANLETVSKSWTEAMAKFDSGDIVSRDDPGERREDARSRRWPRPSSRPHPGRSSRLECLSPATRGASTQESKTRTCFQFGRLSSMERACAAGAPGRRRARPCPRSSRGGPRRRPGRSPAGRTREPRCPRSWPRSPSWPDRCSRQAFTSRPPWPPRRRRAG